MSIKLPGALPLTERALGPDVRVRLWARDDPARDAARLGGHHEVELGAILAGRVRYRIGSQDVWATGGDAVLVPAGASHTTTFDGPLRAVAVWLAPRFLAEAGDAIGVRNMALDAGMAPGARSMVELAQVLARELASAESGQLVVCEALVDALAVTLLRGARAPAGATAPRVATHPKIRRAVERIHASFADTLTAAGLASEVGMSRFAFSRLFREQVGVAPYRYILDVRLDRAAEALRSGRRGVTEVALDVGVGDLGRFGRMFRRRFGCAPSEAAARGRVGRATRVACASRQRMAAVAGDATARIA